VDGAWRSIAGHRVGRVRGPQRGARPDGDETRRRHLPGRAQAQARRTVHARRRRVRPVREHHRAARFAVPVRGRPPERRAARLR